MSTPLSPALNPLQARLALRHHLLAPDGRALVAEDGQPGEPAVLAGALAAALAGSGAFLGVALLGLHGEVGGLLLDGLGAVLGGVLLAGLLTLPPLYLVSALGRRQGSLHHVAAGAAVGPAVCGAWLAAGTPVLLLYAPTGEHSTAFFLLAAGLALLAFVHGATAAARRARKAGASSPGVLAVLAHYALTAWTALVLAIHLA